jgi:glutathione S-transferase
VTQWLSFASHHLRAAAAARLHDMLGEHGVDVLTARADAHRALAILDQHLAERGFDGGCWLVGDNPTIAAWRAFRTWPCPPTAASRSSATIG